MRKLIVIVFLCLSLFAIYVLGFNSGLKSVPSSASPTISIVQEVKLDSDVLWAIIQNWRLENNLKQYVKDQRLCKIAEIRASDIQTDYSHDGLYKKYSNYPYTIQENVAGGLKEQDVLNSWLSSKPHTETLKKNYSYSCVKCMNTLCSQIFSNF